MLSSINLLFTNSHKITLYQVSKDTSIDSLKIKLFRENSDKLPIPSTVFIENEDSLNNTLPPTTNVDNSNEENCSIDKSSKIRDQDDYYTKSHSTIVHQNQIRLIFGGKQLENFSTLEDNSICSGDTILVAISPYISNPNKMDISSTSGSGSDISNSDTVFLGIPTKRMMCTSSEPEKPIFKLSINDRSFRQQQLLNQDQSKSNLLEALSDQDTFKLLNRIKQDSGGSNNNQNQFHNSNNEKDAKLIPVNNISTKFDNNCGLIESLIDRLSLHDIPAKESNDNDSVNSSQITTSIEQSTTSIEQSTTSTEQPTISIEQPITTNNIFSPTSSNSNPNVILSAISSFFSHSATNSSIAPAKPLEIQTFTPIDEVSTCRCIKIIFNRPFLPLVNNLETYEIPIKVEPELPNGKWTTIDGLVFEYKCVKPDSSSSSDVGNYSSFDSNNLIEFPLSTQFKVTIDSKKFKSLYGEDIQESSYSFRTITQNVERVLFNNNLNNPQFKIKFSQPIRLSSSGASSSSGGINYSDIFKIKTEKIGGIIGSKSLSFKVLSNDDKDNFYFSDSGLGYKFCKDSSIVLKITSDIKQLYSHNITVETHMEHIGSKDGPLTRQFKVISKFQTQEVLKLFPEYMKGEDLASLSYIKFNSTCSLKPFDFVGVKKSKTLDQFITIKPEIKITDVRLYDKSIYIYANFRPLKTYHVTLNNFQDSLSMQNSGPSSGYFSFPDYPQRIYLTHDGQSYSYTEQDLYNLDPLYSPSININTEGISKVLVEAYSVTNHDLKKNVKVGRAISFPVIKKLVFNEISGEEEEERSTVTNLDLSKFFGSSTSKTQTSNSILLFQIKSYHDSNVKLSILLQYSPLLVNHVQLGREVSFLVSNINFNKLYDQKELSITAFGDNESSGKLYPHKNYTSTTSYLKLGFKSTHLLIETKDGFKCIYKQSISNGSDIGKFQDKWSIIDQAGIYRPGNTVNIKGLIRIYSDYNQQALAIPSFEYLKANNLISPTTIKTKKQIETITWKLFDGKKELMNGETLLDIVNGSFEFNFVIPIDCKNLGTYYVDLAYNEVYTKKHCIEVQEFKKKQFIVESTLYTLDSSSHNGQSSIGFSETDSVPFSIQVLAKSYTGEIIPETMVEWSIKVDPSFDSLETNYSNYKFNQNGLYLDVSPINYTSKRNSFGRHHLDLAIDSLYNSNITIEATVIDITNHRETIISSFFIKSNQIKYFGLSKDIKPFVNSDQSLVLDMLLCDSKGMGTNDGSINIKIKRMPWIETLPSTLVFDHTILPENKASIIYNYKFKENGQHRVSLTYKNDSNYIQEHHFDIYSLGKQTQDELDFIEPTSIPFSNEKSSKFNAKPTHHSKSFNYLQVKLDKEQYQLNENALLLITSKLVNSFGYVYFVKNDYIIDRFPIIGQSEIKFQFKVTESYLFNTSIIVYLQGTIIKSVSGHKVSRLSNGFESIPLNVDYKSLKQLDIEFINLQKLQTPSQESKVVVNVKNHHQKKPLTNAQVTMMIVDNSILDLRKHSIKNPLDFIFKKQDQFRLQSGTILDSTMFKLIDDIVGERTSDLGSKDGETDRMDDEYYQDKEFDIYVNYFSGRTIMVKVRSSTTITEIKQVLTDRDGLPTYTQRLFYLNKQIGDGTVGENLIKPGSVLKLVIRLFGGGTTDDGELDTKTIQQQETLKSIRLRDNFDPLAHFSTQSTDTNGNATFNYKLPDNLTLYKVMVFVSYKNDMFGTTSDYFTSKLPIQIRPSPPRFLNHQDTAVFPVTISNVLDFDLSFEGAFRSDNCKLLTNQGFKCKLPSNSRIVVPISCKALVPDSVSNFEFVAKTLLDIDRNQELCDAVAFKIPIHSTRSKESTTINNSLDDLESSHEYSSHQLKFDNWRQLDSEAGGLSIQLNTDPLQKASCSLSGLVNYEYYCSEQIASKLISLATYIQYPSLINHETSLDPSSGKPLDKEFAQKAIDEMISRLKKRLTKQFGFRYWDSPQSKEYEFVSMYVFYILNQVSEVSEEAKLLVNGYFEMYIRSAKVFEFNKAQYKEDGKKSYLFRKALSLFFYGQIKDKYPSREFVETIQSKAKKNLSSINYHQIFIYLSQFFRSDPYYSSILNYINITGSLAHLDFNSSNSIYGFTSNLRCQAILISTLLDDKKHQHSHLLKKLVVGLSHYASRDGWFYSTQDNAFNLIAIKSYYSKNFKDLPTNTIASIQLNDHYIEKDKIILLNSIKQDESSGSSGYKSKFEAFLPFKQVLKNQSNIIIEKKSKGILFYTLNLSYATLNPILQSISNRGFSISRKFSPVSNNQDVVYLDNDCSIISSSEGSNTNQLVPNIQIKAGSKVKVSLIIKVDADSPFVAIKDRLPAGLEPIDSKSTQYNGYWSSQVNNRETGIEIFSDLLHKGTYHYNYFAIAITTGTFISPPVKIEEMYCPASFGRSQTDIVLIK